MSDNWKEKVQAAHEMVSALCLPRGSEGSRQWIMSIPAREDYDPDLVITDGLMAMEKHIDAITAERDELRRRLDAVIAHARLNHWNKRFIAIAEGRDND